MQLICEAYFLMKESLGMSSAEMHEVFAEWNKGELDSYLIEITRDINSYITTPSEKISVLLDIGHSFICSGDI